MSLRVLLVTGSYPPHRCGVGDYTERLGTALSEAGLDVSVLTTGSDTAPRREAGVDVYRSLPDWSWRRALRFLGFLHRIGPNIVHIQYPTQGYGAYKLPWLMPLLSWLTGRRVVQTWHEGYARDLAKFTLLVAAPSRIVVVRQAFLQQFGRDFARIAGLRRLLHINSAAALPPKMLSPAETESMRARYGVGDRRLLVFFGFIHPSKQVEQLFAIANPDKDHILVVGDHSDQAAYLEKIVGMTHDARWVGRAQVVGFVEPDEAAAIVAAADAIVLPLKAGGGLWNTAVLAGIQQRTFVLTTSTDPRGYDADANVYYARIDDEAEMRQALEVHVGTKRLAADVNTFTWQSVAARHGELYRSLLPARRRAT